MPATEEVATPSVQTSDNLTVVVPLTAAPNTTTAGKKRKEGPVRMQTDVPAGSTSGAGAKASKRPNKAHHNHPPYGNMIKTALLASQDKKGLSRAAILKYIMQNFEVGENPTLVNARLRLGLKRGVASGILKQMKGTGASGSFRLADAKSEPAEKTKKTVVRKIATSGDVKTPSPKKSSKEKSSKKAVVSKVSKPRGAPKKKVAKEEVAPARNNKSVGGGSKKTKPVASSVSAKAKMTKKPIMHSRSKKVAN